MYLPRFITVITFICLNKVYFLPILKRLFVLYLQSSDILVTRLVDMGHKLGEQRQDQSEGNETQLWEKDS